ncbi:hypothetical protein BDW02DRAFT_407667 [Decorospora gaudefroyi]|uniref:Uncharacterized protein n=1 Tax=Decorospora gaudefroyi TaxID=184978 RepID=A0A6A5K555_9PLEO|nr:hypothetical protein BDW02DRAFT_407667 [Decorospora gaudefroyi]
MISTCLDLALLCHPVLAFLSIQRPKMHAQQSRWQYFLLSFLSLLAIRYASTSYTQAPQDIISDICQTKDQPNPIASLYPMNATGTLNGTISVIPISLKLARELIPSQYGILEHAYRHLLPSFPKDMYPAILEAMHDHEVQAFGYQIPDFSVRPSPTPQESAQKNKKRKNLTHMQRAGISFPFLDLLHDNTTSFKWAPSLLITASHTVALTGASDYGTHTFPATFSPPCDAYTPVPAAKLPHTTSFSARSQHPHPAAISTVFAPTTHDIFPLPFFANVTNQPTFADGKTCDQMIRFFNTSVTTAPNRIESVSGTVKATLFPFSEEMVWDHVLGLRLDTAFVENNYLPCENFRGYDG